MPRVKIAADRQELLEAYRLAFGLYAAKGYVRWGQHGILFSQAFAQGDSRTLVALSPAGTVTATATFVGQSESPGHTDDSVIPWRVLGAEARQRRLGGVTCLAAETTDRTQPAAYFALARFLFQYARFRQYDGLLLAIHPRQLRFYQRICPIVPLGVPYRLSRLGGALAIACCIDLDATSLAQVPAEILAWFTRPLPAAELSRPGISPTDHAFLTQYADIDEHTPSCAEGEAAALACVCDAPAR